MTRLPARFTASALASSLLVLVAGLLAGCTEPQALVAAGPGSSRGPAAAGAGKADDGTSSPDQDAPAETEPAGPEAIATTSAGAVELPATALAAGRILARFRTGSGEGQVGFADAGPEEDGVGDTGDDAGPAGLGVDGAGRVYLLDAVNERVLRLDAAGVQQDSFPTETGLAPLDLGVAPDGSFAVVYGNQGTLEVVLSSPDGRRLAVAPLDDAITPASALYVTGADVMVEHDELRCYPVVQAGSPVPAPAQRAGELPGAPTGSGSLNGALVGDHTALVRLFDAEGFLLREATIQGDRPILGMPVLRPIASGGVVAVLLRDAGDDLQEYFAVRLSPELVVEATEAFRPGVSRGLARDLAVAPDGSVYQLILSDGGAAVTVHLAR